MDMTSLLQQVGSLICYCGSNILLPEKALITVNAQIRFGTAYGRVKKEGYLNLKVQAQLIWCYNIK